MNLRYCNWISVDFPLDIVAHFPTWRCILWLCNLQDPKYHILSRLAIKRTNPDNSYANNRSKWDRKRLWKLHYGWYTILWHFQIIPLADDFINFKIIFFGILYSFGKIQFGKSDSNKTVFNELSFVIFPFITAKSLHSVSKCFSILSK